MPNRKPKFIPNNEVHATTPWEAIHSQTTGLTENPLAARDPLNPARPMGQAKVKTYANVTTGNLFIKDFQQTVNDCGIDFEIGMLFNSLGEPKWQLGLGKALKFNQDSISLVMDDGARVEFKSIDGLNFTAQAVSGYYTLTKQAGTYLLTQPGTGETAHFNSEGFEAQRNDGKGHVTTFVRDDNNLLTEINLPSGNRSIKIDRQVEKISLAIFDGDSTKLQDLNTYTFGNGQLLKTTVALDSGAQYEVDYGYSESGQLQSINQTDNSLLTFGYCTVNDVTCFETITDGVNRASTFKYADNQVEWFVGDQATTTTKATVKYDANHQLQSITRPNKTDPMSIGSTLLTNSYAFTAEGRLSTVTYPEGGPETYQYDTGTGLVSQYVNGMNETSSNIYDVRGALIVHSQTATVGGTEKLIAARRVYDENRVLRFKVSAEGVVTCLCYNSQLVVNYKRTTLKDRYPLDALQVNQGILFSDITAWWSSVDLSQTTLTEFYHNAAGQVNGVKQYAELDSEHQGIETDAMKKVQWECNAKGQWTIKTTQQKAGRNSEVTREIDGLGRETLVQEKIDERTSRQTKTEYLDKQQSIKTILPSGLVRIEHYDKAGLIDSRSESDGTTAQQTAYTRDDRGCINKVTTPTESIDVSYDDQSRLSTTNNNTSLLQAYVYDARGRQTNYYRIPQGESYRPHNPISIDSLLYDAAGRPKYRIDGESRVTEILCDKSGNQVGEIQYTTRLPANTARELNIHGLLAGLVTNADDQKTIHYLNADGLLVGSQSYGGFVTAHKINNLGWVETSQQFQTPVVRVPTWQALVAAIGGDDFAQTDSIRDLLGHETLNIDPENHYTQHAWLGNGKTESTTEFEQPVVGRDPNVLPAPSLNGNDKVTKSSFDLLDRPTAVEEQPQGKLTEYQYAPDNQVTNERVTDTHIQQVHSDRSTTFDSWGLRESSTGPRAGQTKRYKNDVSKGLMLSSTDALAHTIYYYYNSEKERVAEVDANGYVTIYANNSFGQENYSCLIMTKLSDEDRQQIKGGMITDELKTLFKGYRNDDLDILKIIDYNNCEQVVYTEDGEKFSKTQIWDSFGNIASEQTIIDKETKQVKRVDHVVHAFPGGVPGVSEVTTEDPDGFKYETTKELNYLGKVGVIILPNTAKSKEMFLYDKSGNLIAHRVDALAATEAWEVDRWGRELLHQDFSGHAFVTEYRDPKRAISKTSPIQRANGASSVKVFDINDNTIEDIIYNDHELDAINKTKRYDAGNELLKEINPVGLVTQHHPNVLGWNDYTDYDNATALQYKQLFDDNGYVTDTEQVTKNQAYITHFERDGQGKETSTTDANGFVATTFRDRRGFSLIKSTDQKSGGIDTHEVTTHDGLGQTVFDSTQTPHENVLTQQLSDALGRDAGHIVDPITEDVTKVALNLKTQKHRNCFDKLTQVIDPRGNKYWYVYNDAKQLVAEVSAMGVVKGYERDADGRVLVERLYTNQIKTAGLPLEPTPAQVAPTKTDNDGLTYSFYNDDGLLAYKISGKGIVKEYFHDFASREQGFILYSNPIDPSLLKAGDILSIPTIQKDPENDIPELSIFDKNGKEHFLVKHNAQVVELVRDIMGNVIEKIEYNQPLNLANVTGWDEGALITILKNKIYQDDPKNRVELQVFDDFNRLRYHIDNELYVTEHLWDGENIEVDTYAYPTKLANLPSTLDEATFKKIFDPQQATARHTQITPDALKRKVKQVNALNHQEGWQHGVDEHVVTHTDKAGQEWWHTYDDAGRLALDLTPETDVYDTDWDPDEVEKLHLSSILREEIMTQHRTDENGNVTAITQGYGTAHARTLNMAYDADNRCITTSIDNVLIDDPGKVVPTKPGDKTNLKPQSVKTTRVYNTAGKPLVEVDQLGNATFRIYDRDQNLAFKISPSGRVQAFQRNAQGKTLKLTQLFNRINLKLATYVKTGIQLSDVEAIGVLTYDDSLDRNIDFVRNRLGQKLSVTKPKRLMGMITHIDAPNDQIRPQVHLNSDHGETILCEYNNFGDKIKQKTLVFGGDELQAPLWADEDSYLNSSGHVIAEMDADGYVTTYERDFDGAEVNKYQCDSRYQRDGETPDLQTLQAFVQAKKNVDSDIETITQRDILGRTESETIKNEIVDSGSTENGENTMTTQRMDITEAYEYDPRSDKPTKVTLPSGHVKYAQALDEVGRIHFEYATQFTTEDSEGNALLYAPYTSRGFDVFDTPVMQVVSYTVPGHPEINPTIRKSLMFFGNRGEVFAKQDPMGYVKNIAYGKDKRPVRQWEWVSRWQDNAPARKFIPAAMGLTPVSPFSLKKQVRQLTMSYNSDGEQSVQSIRHYDNGQSPVDVISTEYQRNTFGETTGLGPGDHKTFHPVAKVYPDGRTLLTQKDKNVPRVSVYDGLGNEILSLQSQSKDISGTATDQDVRNLISDAEKGNAQRTAMERSLRGDVTVQHRPEYFAQAPQTPSPYYTAFEVVRDYPTEGKVSIRWPIEAKYNLVETLQLQKRNTQEKYFDVLIQRDDKRNKFFADVTGLETAYYNYVLALAYNREDGGGPKIGQNAAPVAAAQTQKTHGQNDEEMARGTLPIITDNVNDSGIVFQVINNNQVLIGGDIQGATGLTLHEINDETDDDVTVSVSPLPGYPNILISDCSKQKTARYQFVLAGTSVPSPTTHFQINTLIMPTQLIPIEIVLPPFNVESNFNRIYTGIGHSSSHHYVTVSDVFFPPVTTYINPNVPGQITYHFSTCDVNSQARPVTGFTGAGKFYDNNGQDQPGNTNSSIGTGTLRVSLRNEWVTLVPDGKPEELKFSGIRKSTSGDAETDDWSWTFSYQGAALYLSPLPDVPGGIADFKMEFLNYRIERTNPGCHPEEQWMILSGTLTASKKALYCNTANLKTGQYKYRLTLIDSQGHEYSTISDYFTITQGENAIPVETQVNQFQQLYPIVTQEHNMNHQVVAQTDELRHTTNWEYTKRNKKRSTIHPSVPVESTAKQKMDNAVLPAIPSSVVPTGLLFRPVEGDNHCFYHAVALYTKEGVFRLREHVFTGLMSYLDDYRYAMLADSDNAEFDDQHIARYLQGVTGDAWAGELEAAVLSRALQRPIVLIGTDGSILNPTPRGLLELPGEPVFVWYDGINHFNGLVLSPAYENRGRELLEALIQAQENTVDQDWVELDEDYEDDSDEDDFQDIASEATQSSPNGATETPRTREATTQTIPKEYQGSKGGASDNEVSPDYPIKEMIRPTETVGRDIDDFVVAHQDGNAHVTVHDRDESGHNIKTTDADGVSTRFVMDGFGENEETIDGLKRVFKQTTDLNGKITSQTGPGRLTDTFENNERGKEISHTTPLRNTTHTNFDVNDNATEHWNGENQKVTKKFDRNNLIIFSDDGDPDSKPIQYLRDFFSNYTQWSDKGGAQYTIERDHNQMMIRQTCACPNAEHGQSYGPDGTLQPTPGQDLSYIYDKAGNQIYIIDNTKGLTADFVAQFHYNAKKECIGETFQGNGGLIYQDTKIILDGMGRILELFDSCVKAQYTYDGVGNRRKTLAMIRTGGKFQLLSVQNDYAYTKANRILVDRGVMFEGQVTISEGQGTFLIYDEAGRRWQEVTVKKVNDKMQTKEIIYDEKGDVTTIKVHGEVSERFSLNDDGDRKGYSKGDTASSMNYNHAGRLISEEDHHKGTSSSRSYDGIDVEGNHAKQNFENHDNPKDSSDKTEYGEVDTTFERYIGKLPSKVSGTVNVEHTDSKGDKHYVPSTLAIVKAFHDPNGYPSSIEGACQQSEGERYFVVCNGRIVMKYNNKGMKSADKFTTYFYDPRNQQPLGMMNLPPYDPAVWPELNKANVNLDLGFHPIGPDFPASAPGSFTVSKPDGMTLAEISQQIYGDPSYGDDLALKNGYSSGESTVDQGASIIIPSLANTNQHNMSGDYSPYNEQAITGSLYPNMIRPRFNPPKHSFVGEFLEILIEVIAIAVTAEFGGAILIDLLIATVANIAEQEVGMATGLQKGFSLKSLGEAEVSTFMGDEFSMLTGVGSGGAKLGAKAAKAAAKSAKEVSNTAKLVTHLAKMGVAAGENLAVQATERLLGLQKKIDWASLAVSAVNSEINQDGHMNSKHYKRWSRAHPVWKTSIDVAKTEIDDGLEDWLHHRRWDPQQEAATALGTVAGDTIVSAGRDLVAQREDAQPEKQVVKDNNALSGKKAAVEPHTHKHVASSAKHQQDEQRGPAKRTTEQASHFKHPSRAQMFQPEKPSVAENATKQRMAQHHRVAAHNTKMQQQTLLDRFAARLTRGATLPPGLDPIQSALNNFQVGILEGGWNDFVDFANFCAYRNSIVGYGVDELLYEGPRYFTNAEYYSNDFQRKYPFKPILIPKNAYFKVPTNHWQRDGYKTLKVISTMKDIHDASSEAKKVLSKRYEPPNLAEGFVNKNSGKLTQSIFEQYTKNEVDKQLGVTQPDQQSQQQLPENLDDLEKQMESHQDRMLFFII